MADSWMVVSEKERNLGDIIANRICAENDSIEACLSAMENVRDEIDEEILWEKPFARNQNEITGNLITQIAYSISEKKLLNEDNGVVLTSNILAEDMVRVSLIEWLITNSDFEERDIIEFVYGNSITCNRHLKDLCAKIKWYDPCVGGGVFPLSIVQVYKEIGIHEMPFIYGYDLDPFYVLATEMRMIYAFGTDKTATIKDRFWVGDVLDTQLEQMSLFNLTEHRESYDIVIGNPPYVRGSAIDKELKKKYIRNFPELERKSTDLYTYFICHGLNVLNETGILTFVTPAQFQMSNYGKPIRKVINKKSDLRLIADFDELPVFKNIGVHTSVYSLSRKKTGNQFRRYEYKELPEVNPLYFLYSDGVCLPQENVSEAGWVFSSADAHSIISFLEKAGMPLKNYSGGVFSGIKTGCKKVFFLDEDDLEDYTEYDLAHCRKMIIPKKITAWKSQWTEDYLAIVKKDEELRVNSELYKRMLLYKDDLCSRSDVVGHGTWYGLRQCGYYDKFDQPKIIYPDISTECRFSMDCDSRYIPDGAFFIAGEDYYLLGILNSCIGRYYFRQKCARIGNPQMGGRIRFKKVYVESFPVINPNKNEDIAKAIVSIARAAVESGTIDKKISRKLDELVLALYNVPDEYKKTIQEY